MKKNIKSGYYDDPVNHPEGGGTCDMCNQEVAPGDGYEADFDSAREIAENAIYERLTGKKFRPQIHGFAEWLGMDDDELDDTVQDIISEAFGGANYICPDCAHDSIRNAAFRWVEDNYEVDEIQSSKKMKNIKSSKRKPIVSAPRSDDGQLEFDFDENDEEDKEYMNKEYTQGEFDFDSVDASDFDPNGNLESWFEEYVSPSGSSETVGGEIVRAAMRILYRSYNDGDQIGRGYGKETVNAAARYLVDKLDGMQIVRDIENQLDHTALYSETNYETWLRGPFTDEVETFLKEHPQLFKQKNDEDMLDFGEEGDKDSRPYEIYLEDRNGIKYYFQENGDEYECYSVEGDGPEFEVGETVNSGDLDFDEDDESPIAVDGNGYAIELEAVGDPDEDGNYSEWEVTDTYVDQPDFDEGTTLSIEDIIGYAEGSWGGYTVCDVNGDELNPGDLY